MATTGAYEPYAHGDDGTFSALYLKVGSIGFEQTWMKKLQDNAPDMVIDTSVGISLPRLPVATSTHVWMSCSNAASPTTSSRRSANWSQEQGFLREELSVAAQHHRQDSTIRRASKRTQIWFTKFVIYHPILTYFARDYQLEQLAIEKERSPGASQLKGS